MVAQHSSDAASPAQTNEHSTAKAAAPHPDHPGKPDSPTDLTKPSWGYVLSKTFREFNRDQCTDLAAALTYYAVLALAPAALALVSLLGVFGDGDQIVDDVMGTAEDMAPGIDLEAVRPIVENLASQEGAGLALITGLLVALWSASGYVNAFSRAMNRMYEIDEGRPIWKLRPWMLLVTLITLVLVAVICAAMVVSGPVAEAVGGVVGLSDQAVTIWNIAKWPVIVLLVALTVAILYWGTPNVRQPKFRWISVGSFVFILVWAVATVAFGFYVANFGSYNETYGSLAGVIVFLLWLWLTNNALLFGAELDAELERGRELQAGMPAEETIQLPPRDTKASEKKQKQHEKDVAKGRALRESRGQDADPDADTDTDRGRGAASTRTRDDAQDGRRARR
ncbi:YihY/virulence factor BrkB family protein [Actinotalea solisilvae]|uniref:YihY/virulence factor BrkB family protein n=1 Tax=Actinotalea solisilvae TaxID=2072922 RepID=UPI0018F16573|nr:YihY/virulence factor BrkB family protein [Actinotalea solisilvae]